MIYHLFPIHDQGPLPAGTSGLEKRSLASKMDNHKGNTPMKAKH